MRFRLAPALVAYCVAVVGMALHAHGEVRVIRVEGSAVYTNGTANDGKPLVRDIHLSDGDSVEAGTNSFVDLQFVESGTLLRVKGGAAILLKPASHPRTFIALTCIPPILIEQDPDNNRWQNEVIVIRGRVVGITKYTNETWSLTLRAKNSSCEIQGGGVDFDYGFLGARSLSGWVSTIEGPKAAPRRVYNFIRARGPDRKAQPIRAEHAKRLKTNVGGLEKSAAEARARGEAGLRMIGRHAHTVQPRSQRCRS